GNTVEDSMGHARFLAFYIVCGIASSFVHAYSIPTSVSPLIGASGAISGVLGAYLILHPRSRLLVLFMHVIPLRLPAWIVLGVWIGLQFLNLQAASGNVGGGGVAWWAHIGGFFIGMILIIPFRRPGIPLLDGIGRFRPKDDTTIVLQETRHQRSIFPNTYRPKNLPRSGRWD
ncbi:MAG: rhomboid family intramembrane serine protease, partial [Proteobacteria bacterium]|nr:rhomboid family intramembrane serine protease [Pseudomonadota bacterium]